MRTMTLVTIVTGWGRVGWGGGQVGVKEVTNGVNLTELYYGSITMKPLYN
jgi:hypothetical protein